MLQHRIGCLHRPLLSSGQRTIEKDQDQIHVLQPEQLQDLEVVRPVHCVLVLTQQILTVKCAF